MVKNMSYSYPIIIIHPIVNKQLFSWNCNVFVFRIFPWCSDKSRSSYCVLYNKKISHILVGLKSHCIPLIFNYIPILYIVYTYSYDIYIYMCVWHPPFGRSTWGAVEATVKWMQTGHGMEKPQKLGYAATIIGKSIYLVHWNCTSKC